MTVKRKQLITFWLLMALMVWPLVHHGLVVRYDLDKWSFLGFSMYITYRPIYTNSTIDFDGSKVTEAEYVDLWGRLQQIYYERIIYGVWYDSGRLASQVFEELPRVDEFKLEFDELRMDRTTAIFEGSHVVYVGRRSGPEGKITFDLTSEPLQHATSAKSTTRDHQSPPQAY